MIGRIKNWMRGRRIRQLLQDKRERREALAKEFRKGVCYRNGEYNVTLISFGGGCIAMGPPYWFVWRASQRQRYIVTYNRFTIVQSAMRYADELAQKSEAMV